MEDTTPVEAVTKTEEETKTAEPATSDNSTDKKEEQKAA
jgi:hypothetical protein